MYILNQSGTEIYNSEFFDHFLIADKPDAKLIVASKGRDVAPYTLGRYADMTEAREVIGSLYNSLRTGDAAFEMPLSEKMSAERTIYDKRTKRKGGS